MERPTRMTLFDTLYILASLDGRGEALFGDSIELVRPAFQRMLIGDDLPSVYFEFPLMGDPCLDMLAVYRRIKPGDAFAPGAGYGRQKMFDWFAGLGPTYPNVSLGLEVDASDGDTEHAGVYLQQRAHTDLVAPFLESVGESDRLEPYMRVYERMPKSWPAAYIGFFPGRAGTPTRIGGYLGTLALQSIMDDPSYLGACFDQIGFGSYDDAMLEQCAELVRLAPSVDFQFDILGDGSLGDTFGLSLSFNETKPRQAHDCMESGYGARIMERLEAWGLADGRWRLIADAAFARHIGYEREDGTTGRLALTVLFNYAKVKFRACVPQPSKFYLCATACDLDQRALFGA